MVKRKVGTYFHRLKTLVFYVIFLFSGWILNFSRFVIDRYSVPQPLNHRTARQGTISFEIKGMVECIYYSSRK